MREKKNEPYKFKVCAKEFSNISSVNAHMRVHTGEKSHTCKKCSKVFSLISNSYKQMSQCATCNITSLNKSKIKPEFYLALVMKRLKI